LVLYRPINGSGGTPERSISNYLVFSASAALTAKAVDLLALLFVDDEIIRHEG
jgi:hypothetical protein